MFNKLNFVTKLANKHLACSHKYKYLSLLSSGDEVEILASPLSTL